MDDFLERIPELQKNLIQRVAGFDEVCAGVHEASQKWKEKEPGNSSFKVVRDYGRRGFDALAADDGASSLWKKSRGIRTAMHPA